MPSVGTSFDASLNELFKHLKKMNLLQGVRLLRFYYSLLGFRGTLLTAKARLLRRRVEVLVAVPGFRYPVHLRLRTTDVFSFHQVLVVGEYDCEFSKPPRVIVDAGANIGVASLLYANKYPEAKIVAIEPEFSNFEMLKKNTAPYSNVIPVHSALWRRNDRISLIDPGLGYWGFQTIDEAERDIAKSSEKVSAITVDKLMADYRIDYIDILKLDIEGSEKEVFESPSLWIDRVGVIVVELHDRFRTGCSRAVYLATQNFEFEWRKGETVFLARRGYVNESPQPAVSNLPDGRAQKTRSYRIIRRYLGGAT